MRAPRSRIAFQFSGSSDRSGRFSSSEWLSESVPAAAGGRVEDIGFQRENGHICDIAYNLDIDTIACKLYGMRPSCMDHELYGSRRSIDGVEPQAARRHAAAVHRDRRGDRG